ncbi:MAG TPA: chromosome segregation protein SMC [Candidatus Saccharicenans sp.]|nr:chromosome segregation protein SMC [Candidatus Saccharicenans sp.]HOL46212.1 chromosome segregation protein SMC [Candidatus Saccharicenans sp.]HPP24429.1 chromosome segregation protein SMC [Candidatus Saccharicenans sp.]
MFIKKLEVQGFKSFADRTKILFHPGITAIIGPNGTGKSNIVDAILWGLGGMRLKSVRGDRTEDIIFNGNTKRPPLSLADVVLTLGNDEELVISHRVFRSGESEYRLNGKSVRLKDIQDELWKNSIGEKEYFVIEQGSIGSFVTSKPQEKRALIEEAAGTAYYKDKKKQAQSKLESSEQNLTRLEDIIIEVEKSKNSLYRQALAAARYRRLRERQRELTAHHFYRRMLKLDRWLEEITTEMERALAAEQELTARVKDGERNISALRKNLWDEEKSLKEKQERVFSLQTQLSRTESETERETKRLEYLETARKRSEEDKTELEEEIKTIGAEIEQTLVRLAELEKSLVEAVQAAEKGRLSWEKASQAVKNEENSLSSLRQAQMAKFQEKTEVHNNLSRLEKELELLSRQGEKLREEKEKLQAEKGRLERSLAELDEQLIEKLKSKEDSEKLLKEANDKLQTSLNEIACLEQKLAEFRRAAEELSYQLQALGKIAETERETTGQAVMSGALGWFPELVEIPEGEATLFDLFWKEEARAQAFLVDDFKKTLPAEIKTNILLLAEEGQNDWPAGLSEEQAVLGKLKSRIKAKEPLAGRLGRLKEAIIVADLSTAIRLWEKYPDLNYISLNGDILESSGLLRPAEKREGLFTLEQEKRKLQKEIDTIQAEQLPLLVELDRLKETRQSVETEIEGLKKAVQDKERELHDLERDKKFAAAELARVMTGLTVTEREESIQAGEKESIDGKKLEASSRLKQVELELRQIEEAIKSKEDRLRTLKDQEQIEERNYYQLRTDRDLLEEKINSSRSHLKSLEKRQEAIKSKIGQLEIEALTSEEEKTSLLKLIAELKQKASTCLEEKQKEQNLLKELEERVQTRQKELEEMESALNEVRAKEEKAREERMQLEIRRAEIERDRVNLEETCWQELKKNLIELRQEIESKEKPGEGNEEAGESEDISRGLAEENEGEETEEPSEEIIEEKPKEQKEKRKGKPLIPVGELTDEELEKELEAINETLLRYRAVNLMAEEEYLEQKKRYDFLVQQRQDLKDSIHSTEEAIKKIDEESKTQFLTALQEVNKNFQEIFALLFRGGTAEVKLLEPDNPLESGVEIVAQPPGKRVQNLTLLSGGEKSLTSLAFLFALFRYKPSPFCILDEVDAALDEANLARFLNLMKAIKHQTQFIIITHNYKTMEVADYIYGTTMEEPNITKVYSVRMERKEFLELEGTNGEVLNDGQPAQNPPEEK